MTARLVRAALIPGYAESAAQETGDRWLFEEADRVRYARNALYLSAAITTIAAIGASGDNTSRRPICSAIFGIGSGIMIVSAAQLYKAISSLGRMYQAVLHRNI